MKSKPRKLGEWQEESQATRQDEEDARKKKKGDAENYSYKVITEEQTIEVKNREEAIRIAKEVNGKVLELIEGCGLGYCWPPELVYNPDKK